MNKQNYIKIIILLLLTILTYIPTFIWMINRWTVIDTYYSHGFLIPLISSFIVWQKRRELNKLKISPSSLGWLFLLGGIFIHIIGSILQVYSSSGFSIILVLTGLILIFWGKEFLNKLLFPVYFLTFMMPLPLVFISNLSFRLKILASQIAVLTVNSLGVKAIRNGSIIITAHFRLAVEDPCSGIRSLIALIALGALMAYFNRLTKAKKIALFLLSIPIAIISNIIRIVILILISEIYGVKIATGILHNIMGILVFVFSFLGLLFVQKVLEQ